MPKYLVSFQTPSSISKSSKHFSYLKIAIKSFIATLKEDKLLAPNKMLLMLLCAECLERNRLGITRQVRNKPDHNTRMYVTVLVTNCSYS